MAKQDAILTLVFISVFTTSSIGLRRGDILESVCSEACRDWEDWRKQCFDTKCQKYLEQGQDWFPCFQSCWSQARECVASCADNFWKIYLRCSYRCLRRSARKRMRCRRACAIRKFTKYRKLMLKPLVVKSPRRTNVVDVPRALTHAARKRGRSH